MENLTNEQLAIMYQKSKCDLIFEELYKRFDKMMLKFMHKHINNNYLDEEEIISACQDGLLKAILAYTEDKPVVLSTMIYRYIQTALHHKYDYMSRFGRDKIQEKSISINTPIKTSRGELPLEVLLNHKSSEDVYFANEFIHMKEAVEYAISKFDNVPFKDYFIPLLIGECEHSEVKDKFNIPYRKIHYQISKFKKYIKDYMMNNDLLHI